MRFWPGNNKNKIKRPMGWTMQGQKHQRILLLDVETPVEPSHSGSGKWVEKKMTKSDIK